MSFAARVEKNPLQQLSFLPQEARALNLRTPLERARLLSQNLRTYENEVLQDRPVSLVYEIDDRTIEGFDSRERDGVFIDGFQKMRTLLANRPGEVVLWYSPAGPAAFTRDETNPYAEITFDYGQLYIQYTDRGRVRAVAIKIKNPDVVNQLLPGISSFACNFTRQEDRIKYFIKHPFATGLIIDDFLDQTFPQLPVYISNTGESFTLPDIFAQVKQAFTQTTDDPPDENIVQLTKNNLTERQIIRIYAESIHNEMHRRRENTLKLGGSCGGREQTLSDIEILLGIHNIFSSEYRIKIQVEEKWGYHDGTCVVCSRESKVGPCNICKSCEKKFGE